MAQGAASRQAWTEDHHESKVEAFYQAGIGHDENWHNGYRNFGWWEDGDLDYVRAADRLVLKMNELLQLGPSSALLDVACGGATQDVLLHQRTGARIWGVDATWAQVVEGQRRISAAGLDGIVSVQHGSATQLEFPDGHFTHALCIEGAQHFNTREDFVRGAARVLRPGGVLAVADFLLMKPPRSPWARLITRRAQQLWHVPDANVVDPAAYRAALERAGFVDVTLEPVGRHIIPGYYRDQNTADVIAAHRRYKGWGWRARQFWTNYFMNASFESGYMEYMLVRAVRA